MALTSMPSARMFRYEDAFTWATRPSAASNKDRIIRITNIGTNGSFFQSNGTRWVPVFGDVTLLCDGAGYTVTGTTSETELLAVTIPGGLMSANGQIEVVSYWSETNNANAKTIRMKIGGFSGTTINSIGAVSFLTMNDLLIVRNDNSTTAQKGMSSSTSGVGSAGTATVSSAIDTSSDFQLSFTGQLTVGTDSIGLVALHVVYRE